MNETLTNYLNRLHKDKRLSVDDRILYLFDTVNNQYYTKVIHPSPNDQCYIFFEDDEPFHDYKRIDVIRAWTVTNAVNCIMGIEVLTGNYCESEA